MEEDEPLELPDQLDLGDANDTADDNDQSAAPEQEEQINENPLDNLVEDEEARNESKETEDDGVDANVGEEETEAGTSMIDQELKR